MHMASATTLIPLPLDDATYRTYSHVARTLELDTPALLRRLLTEIAPVVAQAGEAIERDVEAQTPLPLHLYARLLRGGMLFGTEAMCPLHPAPDAATE